MDMLMILSNVIIQESSHLEYECFQATLLQTRNEISQLSKTGRVR